VPGLAVGMTVELAVTASGERKFVPHRASTRRPSRARARSSSTVALRNPDAALRRHVRRRARRARRERADRVACRRPPCAPRRARASSG
jgi:hypothetical protein